MFRALSVFALLASEAATLPYAVTGKNGGKKLLHFLTPPPAMSGGWRNWRVAYDWRVRPGVVGICLAEDLVVDMEKGDHRSAEGLVCT